METGANDDIQRSTSTCHITRVNTFCLLNIFQYLKVRDLFQMCQVHPMFHEIVTQHIIGRRLIDCNEMSFLIELIFQKFGPFIREIKFSPVNFKVTFLKKKKKKKPSRNNILFELIVRFCKELRKLCLTLCCEKLISRDVLQRALPILSTLESIEISCYRRYESSSKDAVSILQSCPALQEIKIVAMDLPLPFCARLTSLEMSSCDGDSIKRTLLNNPQIRRLCINIFNACDFKYILNISQLQCLKLDSICLDDQENFMNFLTLLAQKNTVIDLTLDWYVQLHPSLCNTIYRDFEKRQKIKDSMRRFTNLKRIRIGRGDKESFVLISDILTSLPNIIECTFGSNVNDTTILSSITEKLKILRIRRNRDIEFYQKLLKAKKTYRNNCLRLFVPKFCIVEYINEIGDEYKPEELKIVPY